MPEKITHRDINLRTEPWSRLGDLGNVPLPSREMLSHIEDQGTIQYPGLVLHILTTSVVERTLMNAIQKANADKDSAGQFQLNPDITFETSPAYHATRPLADKGARRGTDSSIDDYMRTHDDIELATLIAARNGLPISIIEGMEALQRDRGFPERTIGPLNRYRPQDGPDSINWSIALTQIASWLVAGTIQPMERRFEDLRERHVRTADTPKKLTISELDSYQQWGNARVADIAHHIGIEPENFFRWLRSEIFANEDPLAAKEKSDTLILRLFDREPGEDEFLPISPAYRYIAESIMGKRKRRNGVNLISNPEAELDVFIGHGIRREDGVYLADKPRWQKEFDALTEEFPDLESLHGVVENNIWHDHDDAYDHTRNVYKHTKEALQFVFIKDKTTRKAVKKYFQSPHASNATISREDVLEIAAVFHDVAKTEPTEVTVESETGHTYFPTHAGTGARMARAILEEHNYDPIVVDRVTRLIAIHTKIHETQNPQQRQEVLDQMRADHHDIYPDLLVLSMADMQGSQLAKLTYQDYKERMHAYYKAFNDLWL